MNLMDEQEIALLTLLKERTHRGAEASVIRDAISQAEAQL